MEQFSRTASLTEIKLQGTYVHMYVYTQVNLVLTNCLERELVSHLLDTL